MQVDVLLDRLGHGEGKDAVRRFQRHVGLVPDGIVGPKTLGKLEWYQELPIPVTRATPVRVTQYLFAEERFYPQEPTVPLFDSLGKTIAMVRARFFSDVALNGSGILDSGNVVNVAGAYVPVDYKVSDRYQVVYQQYLRYEAIQRAKLKDPKPTRYFGFDVKDGQVTAVQAFKLRDDITVENPYGLGRRDIPFKPFGTMATDIGVKGWKNPDPRYKGKGGLIPVGTRIYHVERGQWYTANDTGGGIYGAHVDEFVGVKSLQKLYPAFPRAHLVINLPDVNERFPVGYSLGLW